MLNVAVYIHTIYSLRYLLLHDDVSHVIGEYYVFTWVSSIVVIACYVIIVHDDGQCVFRLHCSFHSCVRSSAKRIHIIK